MLLTTDRVMQAGLRFSIIKSSPKLFDQLFMVSGHLAEILWRPLVYIYQPDKYQETYDVSFKAISGKH